MVARWRGLCVGEYGGPETNWCMGHKMVEGWILWSGRGISWKHIERPSCPDCRVATQWSPPMENAVKINVDVGFMDAEFFQVAVVARNRDGACS